MYLIAMPLAASSDGRFGDVGGLVGGVVEHLDLEPVERVVDGADRVDQPIDDVLSLNIGSWMVTTGSVANAPLGSGTSCLCFM